MKENGLVINIVGGIEPSNIDQRISLTISKIPSVQCGSAIIPQVDGSPVRLCVCDICCVRVGRGGIAGEAQEGKYPDPEANARKRSSACRHCWGRRDEKEDALEVVTVVTVLKDRSSSHALAYPV